MVLTNYKCKKDDNVLHSMLEKCKKADRVIPNAIGGFGKYVKSNNKLKTIAIVSSVMAIPFVVAYFLSPAYSSFVDATVASTYSGAITGIKELCAFASANPVFTGVLTVMIVATIGALVYMNLDKANQIQKGFELLRDENPTSRMDEVNGAFGILEGKTTFSTRSC
ncbi:MAG: hypothetical protein LKM44_00215 [Wolbachia endosymbiont of Meromenopon meropis]|nr:hypothetical protein [Wolbachia endosymbiont of Meromenopon meropis]